METLRECSEVVVSDMDRFVSEQNVARYRKLLDPGTDERQRRTILQLLKQEKANLREG